MKKLPTFPNCPINNCPGTHVQRTSKRGNPYCQCDTCGAFPNARELWDSEKPLAKARKAKKPTKAQRREAARAERARVLALPQLPVEGFDYSEWGEAFAQSEKQMRLI